MRTRLVNTAADVINRAMLQGRCAASVAIALDSAQMLQDPQTAKEHAELHADLVAALDLLHRVSEARQMDHCDTYEEAYDAVGEVLGTDEHERLARLRRIMRGEPAELPPPFIGCHLCGHSWDSHNQRTPGLTGAEWLAFRHTCTDCGGECVPPASRCSLHGASCDGDMEQAHIMRPAAPVEPSGLDPRSFDRPGQRAAARMLNDDYPTFTAAEVARWQKSQDITAPKAGER